MSSDVPIPASGAVRFSDLKNVFGTRFVGSNSLSWSDLSKENLGNIGQSNAIPYITEPAAFSLSSFRNKNLPPPSVTFTPNITTNVSSSFESIDTSGTLGGTFTYRKRIINRFNLAPSLLKIGKVVADRGGDLIVDGVTYSVVPSDTSNLNPSYVNNAQISLAQFPTTIVSKVAPYSFVVKKRNGLPTTVLSSNIDVSDTLQTRANSFNFTLSKTRNHGDFQNTNHATQHGTRHKTGNSTKPTMYLQTCHEDYYRQHTHRNNHYHRGVDQYDYANVSQAAITNVIGPDYATFQLTQSLSGCSSAGHLGNGQTCTGNWTLQVKPQWLSSPITFGSRSDTFYRHFTQQQSTTHQGQHTNGHTQGYCGLNN